VSTADLVQRFAAHRQLSVVPRPQLEWLAERCQIVRWSTGQTIFETGQRIHTLNVVLEGDIAIRLDRGGVSRKVMEWHAGDIAGLLPYSRLTNAPGNLTAETDIEIAMMDSTHFHELACQCPDLTAVCVHVMLDRARRFTKADLHDEKMLSLGRLAAGLAHELNNPASALARSAKEINGRLFELEATSLALGAVGLSAEKIAAVQSLRRECETVNARLALSPLERADHEEKIERWLASRGLRGDIAVALVESPVSVEGLEKLSRTMDPDAFELALHSIGAASRAQRLLTEVEAAAARIHSLVAAIKGFTHMDQSNIPKPVDIGKGLADTLAVLAGKARRKSVQVAVDVAPDLPQIEGYGGELNQVWQNLIDNAIDAAPPESGRVEVTARTEGKCIVVRVADNGHGVPAEIAEKIFEPFYTTKPQGEGTGLGLDIARQLVRQHEGNLELESKPGRTEFKVSLPRTLMRPKAGAQAAGDGA
jgi:signal transduction histidine kinase